VIEPEVVGSRQLDEGIADTLVSHGGANDFCLLLLSNLICGRVVTVVLFDLHRGAEFLGTLNAVIHFGEGNGRTQREFVRELAHKNGY